LIECKAPIIKLNEDTFKQVLSYQHQLNCELIVISNGLETHTWRIDKEDLMLEKLEGMGGK
jgi:hypothetical protein